MTATATKTSIKTLNKLNSIVHKEIPQKYKADELKSALEKLSSYMGVEFWYQIVPTFEDQNKKTKALSYGFAFAIGKTVDNFMIDNPDGTFSYRDSEVKKGLKKIIEDLELKPVIHWERGMGVFVFNLYFKD